LAARISGSRIFRGWSQLDVERQSGVDQTTISRFERADEQGLSIHRLAAMLAALNVGEIDFRPPPGSPPTPLELMIYGDRWLKSGDAADRRLARPRRQRR
jgi:transcriptional regulator with XRE-family HTH domain